MKIKMNEWNDTSPFPQTSWSLYGIGHFEPLGHGMQRLVPFLMV